jgi:hypothetical protein
MKFLISYVSTKRKMLDNFWAENKSSSGFMVGSDKMKPENLGGIIDIVDIKSKKILKSKKFSKPSAMTACNNGNYLCATSSNEILILTKELDIIGVIRSPLFNSIHSINIDKDGFLVCSTGIDTVVRVRDGDFSSDIVWSALNDSIYAFFPDGSRRVLDFASDHSEASYPTLQQTTHINSAVSLSGSRFILATLFHQGELVKISTETKKVDVILRDLASPHGAHVYAVAGRTMAMCSDTLNNRVILDINLDENPNDNYRILEDGFNWVQDAKYYPDDNIIVVLDSNNHRVCIYDYLNLTKLDEYIYDSDNRIFDIIKI